MAKKKKKNKIKNNLQKKTQNKTVNKTKQQEKKEKQIKKEIQEVEVLPTQNTSISTENSFSKRLEDIIKRNFKNKKSSESDKVYNNIILLGPPESDALLDWLKIRSKATKAFKHFIIALLIVGLMSSAVVTIELLSENRILPGVAFAQEEVGYQPYEVIKEDITKKINNFFTSSITFNYQDKEVSIPVKDLSVVYQVDESIKQLPIFHFKQNNLIGLIGETFKTKKVFPIYQKEDDKIFDLVEEKLNLKESRALSAKLVKNDNKKLEITEEKNGIVIDKEALLKDIENRFLSLNNQPITIKTIEEQPLITKSELESELSDIQVKLENKINIKTNTDTKKSWTFKAIDHLDNIIYQRDNGQITIKISKNLIQNYLSEDIFSQIEKEAPSVKITYNDQKVDFDGNIFYGVEVDKNKVVNDLELAINSLDQEVEIITEESQPKIDIDPKLQAMGIKEIIGIGHTAFAGSTSNRRWNIDVAMKKYNGLIIKPGEIFSFNDNLGPVDGSTGYKLELVITGAGTVPEYGGGVCQVSSTVFKAALFSGLPIVERSPHSYAVSYYAQVDGYGLDATIYPGVKDFKFENDTPSNMLVHTFIDGDHAYVVFLGTSDGRKVTLTDYWRGNYRGAGGTELIPTKTLPTGQRKQIETAHGGFDASWKRTITTASGETKEETVYSVYRSTANRILVGE